ncbi:protein asteroid homolog 1 [Pelobates fuscus]|uniref:protein asteroid homolog 1 n=1 Tax=Pelobates fuscus TaxID=191477 RepID=UPI002FE4716A
MGVQGLTSFLGSNIHLLTDLKLRSTKLVIDGNNLYHKLYLDSGLEQVHGGNYDSFTNLIYKFFESLSRCEINAYVVFDGGCDISDKKLETQKQRMKERIRKAQSLSKGENGQVLPLMVRDVFIKVLTKLQVNFVQCFSEADQDIAALANVLDCPVLTLDSDFCIFYLNAGYCPFSYFQWRNINPSTSENDCYIPAKCFSAKYFCNYFNINMSLLPLFATLAGNDYMNTTALEKIFSKIRLCIGSQKYSGKKHGHIHYLLDWLPAFANAEEAIIYVMNKLREQDRDAVREFLTLAMADYDLHDVQNLACFFNKGSYFSSTAIKLNLPDWVQIALAKGLLAPMISDVLLLRRTFLHVQVEDMRRASAHMITQPIRQVMYGLILNFYHDTIASHETQQSGKFFIEEFDRLENHLRKTSVEAISMSREFSEDLSLQKLPEVSLETRLSMFVVTFGVKMSTLESVPPAHRLTIATTCYWVANSSSKVRQHHLKALVMGLVYGEACEMMTKPELHGEDIRLVYEKLRNIKKGQQCGRRRHGHDDGPNVEDLHIFCQWQCCFQTGLHFNQLLCTPLQEPDITRIYNGPLVHQLCHKLKTLSSTEDLFNPSPMLDKLYRSLIQAVMSSLPPDHFQSKSKSKSGKPKKAKTAGKAAENTKGRKQTGNQSNINVGNRFASLDVDELA